MRKIILALAVLFLFALFVSQALAFSAIQVSDKTLAKNPCDKTVMPDDVYADFKAALAKFLSGEALAGIDKQIADDTKTKKAVPIEVYIEDLDGFKKQWKNDTDTLPGNKGKTDEEFNEEAESIYNSHPAYTYTSDETQKGVQVIKVKFFCTKDLRLRTIDNNETGGWKLYEEILHEFIHAKLYAYDVLGLKPPLKDHDDDPENDEAEEFFKKFKEYFDKYKGSFAALSRPGENLIPLEEVSYSDLGLQEPRLLPTSRWYFLKEWGRGLRSLFTFSQTAKVGLGLEIANEKAAEAKAVKEKNPEDTTALSKALRNYEKSQTRLKERLEALKETSENPNVAKLIERVDYLSAKHTRLFDLIAQKHIGQPAYEDVAKEVEGLRSKITETLINAAEKDKDIKEKAGDQIEKAEKAVSDLERSLMGGSDPQGLVINEPTISNIKDCICLEWQQPKPPYVCLKWQNNCDPGRIGNLNSGLKLLSQAKDHLLAAKQAFSEGKYGEAFGLARSAEGLAMERHKDIQGLDAPTMEFTTGDPYRLGVELFFDMEVDGKSIAKFRSVDGLENAQEVIEYKEGTDQIAHKRPGKTNYSNIILRRGNLHTPELWEWRKKVVKGITERKTISIIINKGDAKPAARYNYFEAWPCKWAGFSLDAASPGMPVEEISICVEGITPQKVSEPAPTPKPVCEIQCLRYDPVCGSDGKTYSCGAAEAECNGVKVAYSGECRSAPTQPSCICTKEYSPVCGVDGDTYPNSCEAKCAGAEINYAGECKVAVPLPPATTEGCSKDYIPVCGSDGKTYTNKCFAYEGKVGIAYSGECNIAAEPPPPPPPSPSTTLEPEASVETAIMEFKLEADDLGFYPTSVIEVSKGAAVKIHFFVRSTNVYYGGLDFRSSKFKTASVKPGESATVEFVADQPFDFSSYWPLSNVLKATGKVVVR